MVHFRPMLLVAAATLLATGCSGGGGTDGANTPDGGSVTGSPTSSAADGAGTGSGTGDEVIDRQADPGDGGTPVDDGSDPATGSESPSGVEATDFDVQPAVWTGCGDGYECAEVAVPLDHDRPSGPTIDLALVRVPAAAPDGAVGSILVNPGGPGGSGIDYVRSGFRLDRATMNDHHLVGFDPRGVGASNPLACGAEAIDGPLPDYDPDDDRERAELDRFARSLAERCQAIDGDLLPNVSTNSVVADLDILRQAVGDERLSYLGLSYGTVIGLRYAERHPERVGRMILDGVVDPASTLTGLLSQQADGFDRVFAAADEACGRSLSCPDGGLAATYDRVAARLDTDGPIDGIGPTELAIGTLLPLYAESLWSRYAAALADADRGRVDGIRSLFDLYAGAADEAAYNAVVCTDTPVPAGPEAWDRLADDLAARSPRFGAFLANEVRACAHWPVRASTAPEPVSPTGIPPILVLSTTGDAATPVENALRVAATLDGAGLVTVEDTSHTAYGRNFCVEQIVADYVATGDVPSAIHRC